MEHGSPAISVSGTNDVLRILRSLVGHSFEGGHFRRTGRFTLRIALAILKWWGQA
jgi:hypothetical protein